MAGRRVGVGFNRPRVLGVRWRSDYQLSWQICRDITRLHKASSHVSNVLWGISAVETHRVLYDDIRMKPKQTKGKRRVRT